MLESRVCSNCHIGILKPTRSTFAQWLGEGRMLVAPDQLMWACDVCQESFHDDHALMRIGLVLGHQMKRVKARPSGATSRGDASPGKAGSNSKQRSLK